jgi:adenylate kinase
MGGLLRNISKEDSPLGKEVAEIINSGKLVSDEVVVKIVNSYLAGLEKVEGILFDGFPRVLSQAQYFEKYLAENNKKLDLVIFLTLPRDEIFKRLSNRRTCSSCGKVFNVLTKPPKVENICDFCGGSLIIRQDETPEKINTRLNTFENQTLPVVDYFRQKGTVEEVDGSRPIEEIFTDIVERIKKRGLTENV